MIVLNVNHIMEQGVNDADSIMPILFNSLRVVSAVMSGKKYGHHIVDIYGNHRSSVPLRIRKSFQPFPVFK
jgi:hypothetical protein